MTHTPDAHGQSHGPSPQRVMDLANAFYESCLLFSASDLGVFAALARRGESTAGELARELALDARALRLLLDGLVAVGLLIKNGEAYHNSPDAALFLVPGSPADLSGAIRYNRDVYAAWGRLKDLVRTGRPVESPEVHLGTDPERTRTFVMAMHYRALGMGRALIPHLHNAGPLRVLDVGGGPGTYSALMARANPEARFTVLDLPAVVAIARELVAAEGLSDRVTMRAGDYRTAEFPAGMDRVNFFGVLHQEAPESILSLFRKAHAALREGGEVNVMDLMTDASRAQPRFSALFAVNMALTTDNGWVFSDEDLAGWLKSAGFRDVTIRPLPPPMPHWLATAKK